MPDDRANDTPRLSKTFSGNVVSIRLLLFHVHFLQQVARPSTQYDLDFVASIYDQRYGAKEGERREDNREGNLELT
jgi:hypothetical protein